MSYKDTGITNPGTSIRYGADDMEVIARLFNGVTTGVHPVTIKSTNKWGFWDNILYFRNQADSRNTTIRGQSNVPSTDVTLTLPPIPTNDTLPAIGLAQTWALKQRFDSGIVLNQMSTPSAPGSGLHQLYVAANGHLVKTDNSLVTKDYDTTAQSVPIEMEDGVLALRDWDTRFFRSGSSYYAIKSDGSVLSSGTVAETVLQTAITNASNSLYIGEGTDTIELSAGFTGFTVTGNRTIFIDKSVDLRVPQGFTGSLFTITADRVKILGNGGDIGESGTIAGNWTAVQIGTGLVGDAIRLVEISGLEFNHCGTCIELKQGGGGLIDNVLISNNDMRNAAKKFMLWTTTVNNKILDVTISNNRIDASVETTDCFKNVAGARNVFIGNTLRDFDGAMNEMDTTTNAINTMVFGGNHTGNIGTFTDLGTNTYIDDAIHTEFKFKGTAITGSAISSTQNDYAPTGWNEKQNNLRVSSTGTQTITGLACGPNPKNRIVRISNVGATDSIILASENVGSTAANRFKFFGDITVQPNQAITLFYSADDSRWRALSDVSAVGVLANVANTFTQVQTIQPTSGDALFLYRPINTVGTNADINWDFQNSVSDRLTYGDIRVQIADNTDNAEIADFRVNLQHLGTKEVGILRASPTAGLDIFTPTNTIGADTAIHFLAKDSLGSQTEYVRIWSDLTDNTDGSEDGTFEIASMTAGSLTSKFRIDSSGDTHVLAGDFEIIKDGGSDLLYLRRTDNTAGNDCEIRFLLEDSGAASQEYFRIGAEIATNTAGAEFGRCNFSIVDNGAITNHWVMDNDGAFNVLAGAVNITRDASAQFLDFYRTDNTGNIELSFYLQDSGAAKQLYGQLLFNVHSNTAGAETGRMGINLVKAGTIRDTHAFYSDASMDFYNYANVDNDFIGLSFYLNDSSNNKTRYAAMEVFADDTGNGSEDGSIWWRCIRAGTEQYVMAIRDSGNLSVGRDVNFQRFVPSIIARGTGGGAINTGTETTWFSFTIKANTMGAEGSVDVVAWGVITQNSATATNYNIRVKLGGTTIYSDELGGALSQSGVGRPFMLNMTFANVGSTNSNRVYGLFAMNDTSAPNTGEGEISDDEGQALQIGKSFIQSFDTTGDLTFLVSIDMDQTQTNSGWDGHWWRATLYPSS